MYVEFDDEFVCFDVYGGMLLLVVDVEGWFDYDGVCMWYVLFGQGLVVVLLYGGFGYGGNWGNQVLVLFVVGYCVIVIDSCGYGCSMCDD